MITAADPRCEGVRCPSKTNCRRYTERDDKGHQGYAAFYSRREAGASACESIIPVVKRSTFDAVESGCGGNYC